MNGTNVLTLGSAVRIKDGKKGRPKKWIIVQWIISEDDAVKDLVVLECMKTHVQTTVSVDSVVPYPSKPLDELAKQAQELGMGY